MNNDELQSYLSQVLTTTFILDDGTRLKPIYIQWKDLSPEQTQVALAAIKRVVTEELKNLSAGSRLRLEFNEIPDELDEMLAGIAGRDNKEFEWTQLGAR